MLSRQQVRNSSVSLCFDDILLVPQYSELESRTSPDISTKIGHLVLGCPIISSPMDSITREEMLLAMSNAGGLGILTRFIGDENEAKKQCAEIRSAKSRGARMVGCAIGVKSNSREHATQLLDQGCDLICIDVAHGDHVKMYKSVEDVARLKNAYKFTLMAGNVCTPCATKRFVLSGVDSIKVGIGPGAVCTTRRVTGFGCPQLTAILECSEVIETEFAHHNISIIADGGLRSSGDMVKSLWAGAHACMIGFMLAGTSATPDFGNDKVYRGMSSRTTHRRSDVAAEGVDIRMEYHGKTESKLEEYKQGLQSGFAMAGARRLNDLRTVKALQVSYATMKESAPVCG